LANSDGHCSHYYSWKFDGIDTGDFATVYAPSYRNRANRLGHFGSIGYFTLAWIGKRLGNKAQSTEDIKVSKSLGFLRDTSVAMSLTEEYYYHDRGGGRWFEPSRNHQFEKGEFHEHIFSVI
jgi:hypothetical protein